MYFDLTDEQQAIRATAKEFLAARYKSERIGELAASETGSDPAGWSEMADIARARPAGVSVREWHDAMLAHDCPPPRHLRTLLGG